MPLRTLLLLALVLAFPALALAQQTFTPLTNLPGISETVNADTLPDFFNNLYKICIGAAAVIAVLQIMRAGAYFMFNKGSVAQNEQAKHLIGNSVLGLLLVLSPAIVFGIINPDILDLRLDLSGLRRDAEVERWIDTCNIEASVQARECAGTVRAAMEEQYRECVRGNTPALCAGQARESAQLRIRACIAGRVTNETSISAAQFSCLDEQVNSWLESEGVDVSREEELARCETFIPASRQVVRSDDNTDRCPAIGKVLASPVCCQDLGIGNFEKCCALRAQTMYLLAYHYTQTRGGSSCRLEFVRTYADQTACTQARPATDRPALPPSSDGATFSAPTIVKSCETGDASYTIPADPNMPKCGAPPAQ